MRQILERLHQGDHDLAALAAGTGLDVKTVSQNLIRAIRQSLVERIQGTRTHHLTAAGRAWLTGGAAPATTRKAAAKKPRKAKDAPAIQEAADAPSFRCCVFNDGSFFLAKDEISIELDNAELHAMQQYLTRATEALAG